MKSVKLALFSIAIACVFVGCKKGSDDDDADCMDNNTTEVTFKNIGSVPLRLKVATSLTPQMEPINPIINLDLDPGEVSIMDIPADMYHLLWYSNCATACTAYTSYVKTYEQCAEYVEEKGF